MEIGRSEPLFGKSDRKGRLCENTSSMSMSTVCARPTHVNHGVKVRIGGRVVFVFETLSGGRGANLRSHGTP